MTISDATTIANNSADDYGGGVANFANMTISLSFPIPLTHHNRPPPHAHRRHAPNASPLQGCNVEMGVKTLCAGASKNGN